MKKKKLSVIFITSLLCISLLFPTAAFALTRDDIIATFGSITWSENTVRRLGSDYTCEIAMQMPTTRMNGTFKGNYVAVGSNDILYFPPGIYGTDGSEKIIKGGEQAFSNVYSFLTMPELKIGGVQYFVAVRYNSNATSTPAKEEKKSIIDALKKVKEGMAANATEENLKSLVSKYIQPYTFTPYNYNYITDSSVGGSFGQTVNDETLSKEYRFIYANGDYIIAGPNASANSGSIYHATVLNKKTTKTPCVAIKNDSFKVGGKSYWILCDFTKNASEATSDVEIDDLLSELMSIIEAEKEGESEAFEGEDDSGISIGTDPGAEEGGAEVIEDTPFDSGLSSELVNIKSFNKDPLSYIDDFSFANTNETDEKEMKALSSSFYNLMLTFSIVGLALSITTGAIKLMVGGYKAKNDVLNALLAKSGIFILISGFAGFIGSIILIIESLV